MKTALTIENGRLGRTAKVGGVSLGVIQSGIVGLGPKQYRHAYSDRWFGSEDEAALDLHERAKHFLILEDK